MIDERDEAEYEARKRNCLSAGKKQGGFVGLKSGIALGQYLCLMPDGTPILSDSHDYRSPRIINARAWRVSRACTEQMRASMEE